MRIFNTHYLSRTIALALVGLAQMAFADDALTARNKSLV